jgi:hypothetical protein
MLCVRISVCAGLAATLGLLALVGCGSSGPSKTEIAQERARVTGILSASVARRDRLAALQAARQREAKCRSQVGSALQILDSVNSSTSGGITLSYYGNRRDELETELDRIPRGSLDQQCLRVLKLVNQGASDHRGAYDSFYSCAVTYADVCDINTDKTYLFLIHSYWQSASSDARHAEKQLQSIGAHPHPPTKASPFLPRTDGAVHASIYGRIADRLCSSNVLKAAVEPCQALQDVLAGGVGEDEEADLNEALSAIASAYGIGEPTGKA